jgi:hypothetical protein
MDGNGMRQEGLDDPVLVTERVLDEARRTYGEMDAGVLEHVVHQAIADLWTDSIRVTSFVPVLAMRRVREVVEARPTIPVEAPSTLPVEAPPVVVVAAVSRSA